MNSERGYLWTWLKLCSNIISVVMSCVFLRLLRVNMHVSWLLFLELPTLKKVTSPRSRDRFENTANVGAPQRPMNSTSYAPGCDEKDCSWLAGNFLYLLRCNSWGDLYADSPGPRRLTASKAPFRKVQDLAQVYIFQPRGSLSMVQSSSVHWSYRSVRWFLQTSEGYNGWHVAG